MVYNTLKNLLGRGHSTLLGRAVDNLEVIAHSGSLEVDLTHTALKVERGLVDILLTIEVAAVIALTLLRELALGETERHVEEQRQIGTRDGKLLELGSKDPVTQRIALLATTHLGTLVADIRVDIAVDNNHLTLRQPGVYSLCAVSSIASIQQRNEVWVYLLHRAQVATQEAGNEIAINGCVEAWKVQILRLDTSIGKQSLELGNLRRLASTIQTL